MPVKTTDSPADGERLSKQAFDNRFIKFAVQSGYTHQPEALLMPVLNLLNCWRDEEQADRVALILLVHFQDELREALDGQVATTKPRSTRRTRNPDPQAGLRVYDSETGSRILVPMWLWLR